ncbi:zinc-binding dehydrogenase [Rubrobacter tropicus]|uniref:Zinc-binding dehydrogenase n=1 Tax=Rubrobacter tropicus TaxID=2653851 RepID=A0A6G8Q6V2_9ACTN|nr:zinc-binding dehydrogenase [Rubrobacter tropicus]QIN82169.1 zinc-binding dehydrogenase [Rubrobacter tropicus]
MRSAARDSLKATALWFPARRVAQLRPETVPVPGQGEVRVRAVLSAVSHGTEMLVYRGEVPEDLSLDLPTFAGGFSFPIKHGYASAGRVLDTGPGVENLAPGDPVFVHHPHQDVFTVPADLPVRLPGDLDLSRAVFFANMETALNVVHDSPARLGETALVFGQGVVGLLVTRLLKMSGTSVLAVEPVPERRELALKMGADAVFGPDEDPKGRVFAATGGRGADVAVEASGSGAALAAAVECVAVEGTVVAASWYGKKEVGLPLGGRFHRGRVKIKSSQVGRMTPELGARWDRGRRAEAVISLLQDPLLPLDSFVSHRVPFGEAPGVYGMLDRGDVGAVQVVFDYGEA